ncbi:MAG: SMP-30/gluconolactonase/LRE family protein [Pseudomonadota bacterium]|nr:SMP-30/gluconolactonase/LRE family protein [Pseudomonadota bacterium]
MEATCVVDCRNVLGEGAVWCPLEQKLWWIDIAAPSLWTCDARGGRLAHWPLPKPPGSFALRRDGGFLFAFRNGLATLDKPGDEPQWLPGPSLGEERFNDGKADRAGRFWTGTLDRKLASAIGRLYRLSPKFEVTPMDDGFTISNGIGWSPDDRTMYFTDTPSRRIYRYDFDPASGEIANRRVFVEVEAGNGGPDGMTVDAEGGVWSAQFDRCCINRYTPDGKLERSVGLPVQRPTSCMFGGADLTTLYVTSASMDLAPQPFAGGLFALDPGVRGLPEPRFAG